MTRFWRRSIAVCLLTVATMSALASPAAAAYTGYKDFGPWLPQPTGNNSSQFQANIQPFSTTNDPEITNFACTMQVGNWTRPLTGDEQAIIGQIISDATAVFNGSWDALSNYMPARDEHGVPIFQALKKKWPKGGQAAMDFFLADQKSYLTNRGSAISQSVTDWKSSHQQTRRSQLAQSLNVNADSPVKLASAFGPSCGFQVFNVPGPSFWDLLSNPAKFFLQLIIWLLAQPIQWAYNLVQPAAFQWTFWTPHSERGDTIFNVASSCYIVQAASIQKDPGASASCTQGNGSLVPLGFDKTNLHSTNLATHWYIWLSFFIQWLVSGTYFLILFAAAIVYMFRGNRGAVLNAAQVVPRLLLAAGLTLFAAFIIGALITVSNTLTDSLLGSSNSAAAQSVGAINDVMRTSFQSLSDSATVSDFGLNTLLSGLVQIIVGAAVVFFFCTFILTAVLRQVLLIILIVLAPVACMCLIVPSWRGRFGLYVRLLLACVFAPTILALVLAIGMSINPMVNGGTNLSTLTILLGLALLVFTLWAMARVTKMLRAYATGGGTGSLFGRSLSQLGMMAGATAAFGPVGGKVAAALAGGGKALGMAGNASMAMDRASSSLTPRHKGMMGYTMARRGRIAEVASAFGLSEKSAGFLPFGGGSGGGSGGGHHAGAGRATSAVLRHMEKGGRRRGLHEISPAQAAQMQADRAHGVQDAIETRRKELASQGRQMTAEDAHRAEDDFLHGKAKIDERTGRMLTDPKTGEIQREGGGYNEQHPGQIRRVGGRTILDDPSSAQERAPLRDRAGVAAREVGSAAARAGGWSARRLGPGDTVRAAGWATDRVASRVAPDRWQHVREKATEVRQAKLGGGESQANKALDWYMQKNKAGGQAQAQREQDLDQRYGRESRTPAVSACRTCGRPLRPGETVCSNCVAGAVA